MPDSGLWVQASLSADILDRIRIQNSELKSEIPDSRLRVQTLVLHAFHSQDSIAQAKVQTSMSLGIPDFRLWS